MISRRAILAGLGCTAAFAPPLGAQTSRLLPTIALVLGTAPKAGMVGRSPSIGFVRAFIHAMSDLGWIDGQTVSIERWSAEGDPSRAMGLLREIAASRVDVIVSGGERWLLDAALAATADIPIVANLIVDPVAAGLVQSLARPGGNLTGVTRAATGSAFDAKAVQLLREFAPGANRIAVLSGPLGVRQFLSQPQAQGVTIVPVEIDSLDQLDAALEAVAKAGVGGLVVGTDGPAFFGERKIVDFAAAARLPTIFGSIEAVQAGGLIAYGPGANSRWRQMAQLASRFLNGAKPGEVPIENPTSMRLVVNAKAAAALGLSVPVTLAAQADEVIE